MKKILTLSSIAVIFATLFTITSCSKAPLVITYTMDDMTACLIADPYQGYQTFTFNLDHDDVAAILTSNSVDISRVTDTKLAKIKAVITTPGATNFDQIDNIEVYMKAAGATGNGDQIAYTPSIGDGVIEVVFTINGVDLKSILSEDKVITVKVLNGTNGNAPVCIKLTEGKVEITARK